MAAHLLHTLAQASSKREVRPIQVKSDNCSVAMLSRDEEKPVVREPSLHAPSYHLPPAARWPPWPSPSQSTLLMRSSALVRRGRSTAVWFVETDIML